LAIPVTNNLTIVLRSVNPNIDNEIRRGSINMKLLPRRTQVVIQQKLEEAGQRTDAPMTRVAAIVTVANPLLGEFAQDLRPLMEASVEIGAMMGDMIASAIPPETIESYGKGGIVGVRGEQEHANALLTSAFADPIRNRIGGGKAWISSFTKIGGPGTVLDVPMNHRYDVYVRSHYDGMSFALADGPLPDEIALVFCVSDRGRLNARVGGLTHEEVMSKLGGVSA
jgi:hypothetical protein